MNENLLSTVLNQTIIENSIQIKDNTIHYMAITNKLGITAPRNLSINIFEFAYKCEEYIYNEYQFTFFILPYLKESENIIYFIDILYPTWTLENFEVVSGIDNVHNTKIGAIFYATQFIIENQKEL